MSWPRRIAIVLGVLAVCGVAAGVDAAIRYLPAARALQQGRDALLDAQSALRGSSAPSAAQIARATADLQVAREAFGDRSSIVEDGWLAGALAHLPFAGTQVDAMRTLRATGEAAARLGLDAIPVLTSTTAGTDAPGAGVLQRLIAIGGQHDALTRLSADVDALDADLHAVPDGLLLPPLDHPRTTARQQGGALVSDLRAALGILPAVPDAIGPGTHRYLLLLTNPGEERPAGGFVGAFGDVAIDNGQVTSVAFHQSDYTDKLVTDIPAPRQIAWLTNGKLTLADSGWAPDFGSAGATAENLVSRATGEQFDGVIEVDPVALGYVLGVVGPVHVAPYPQTVSGANALFELNYIINSARPGDPGKSYLAPFGAAVLDKVLHVPSGRLGALAQALVRGVSEKHVVLQFRDAALQRLVTQHGAGGTMPSTCGDCLLVDDANLSATKGDLYVTRRFDLVATVDSKGTVHDRLTLTYHNPRPPASADAALVRNSGGQYQDYLRVYLPSTGRFDDMYVSDGDTPTLSSVSPEDAGTENGRQYVAYDLLVVPNGSATVVLDYEGSFAGLASDGSVTYNLAWQKQNGALPWPISVDVRFADGHQQHWTSDLSTDRRFSATSR